MTLAKVIRCASPKRITLAGLAGLALVLISSSALGSSLVE